MIQCLMNELSSFDLEGLVQCLGAQQKKRGGTDKGKAESQRSSRRADKESRDESLQLSHRPRLRLRGSGRSPDFNPAQD